MGAIVSSMPRGLGCTCLLALGIAGSPVAQTPHGPPSASHSFIAVSAGLSRVGGAAASSGYHLSLAADTVIAHERTASGGHALEGGVLWTEFTPVPGPPRPVAVVPATGSSGGAEVVEVVALNATDGSGAVWGVLFGGVPAAGVSPDPTAATRLSAITPFGAACNSKGPVAVTVSHAQGSGTLDGGFAYLPALTQLAPAHAGGELELAIQAAGSFTPLLAVSPPGPPSLLPPFGCLELSLAYSLLPINAVFTGEPVIFRAELPPELSGVSLDFQALALTFGAGAPGAFTNRITVPVL